MVQNPNVGVAPLMLTCPLQVSKPNSFCDCHSLTYSSDLEKCICPPSKDKREQDSDLYAYREDVLKEKREQDSDLYGYPGSKPPKAGCPGRGPGCYCPGGPGCPSEDKRELDGDLYNYVDGDSVDYKAKRELDGDLYNYVDGDSINYKAKREDDSGLYSKPPVGTCKGGGPGCFCPNGEPGCTPTPPEEEAAKRELDGDLYNYVDGDSVNYKAKREQDGGLYSKPPKGNPNYPYCPGPVGCAPPEGDS